MFGLLRIGRDVSGAAAAAGALRDSSSKWRGESTVSLRWPQEYSHPGGLASADDLSARDHEGMELQ